jgi:hypothetical protein
LDCYSNFWIAVSCACYNKKQPKREIMVWQTPTIAGLDYIHTVYCILGLALIWQAARVLTILIDNPICQLH